MRNKDIKVGQLVKWKDYTHPGPVEHLGLVIATDQNMGWADLRVLTEGEYSWWPSVQCEVINESRR